MKYAIQIKVPVLQLCTGIWDMRLSQNVKIHALKWKSTPNSSSNTNTKTSKRYRSFSRQKLSYLWKLSQNPCSQQVKKTWNLPSFKITMKHFLLLVAEAGGFLGMILGFSLLDLEVVLRLLLSNLHSIKSRLTFGSK